MGAREKGYNSAVEYHLDVVEVISSSLIIPKPNVSFYILMPWSNENWEWIRGSWDWREGGGLYFWERTPDEYEAHGYKLCRGMKENSESALSTSKEAISNATRNLMESSILAQDERWRHALHMQVGREVVFPVADGWVTRKNLPLGGEQQLETAANTP